MALVLIGDGGRLGFHFLHERFKALPVLQETQELSGSVLVVDRSSGGISRDGIYALELDGTLLVRRLQRLPGGQVEASAESGTYQSFRFHPNDSDVNILGRSIWAGREL